MDTTKLDSFLLHVLKYKGLQKITFLFFNSSSLLHFYALLFDLPKKACRCHRT